VIAFKSSGKKCVEWRWESDGIVYNTKNKAHRTRHKTARKNAIRFYLFVAVRGSRTSNRREFFYEFTDLDTVCFEKFLELFASKYFLNLHIIQGDNGGFHNYLNFSIPENVILLFGPAYSPEINPIERLWEYIKKQLKWLRF